MATNVSSEIARLASRISALDTIISDQEALSSITEGGNGASFSSTFTDINKLYMQREKLATRLLILEKIV